MFVFLGYHNIKRLLLKGVDMKSKQIHYLFPVFFILVLPNCGRVVDWGVDNFYQGQERNYDRTLINTYLREKRIYDQFDTAGFFTALWLSSPVRSLYADMVSEMYGKNEERHKSFLRRQIEETRHFISFYLLSTYGIPLGESDSKWVITLRINDVYYTPVELKTVELPLEYKSIFGPHYNRFKLPYLLKFDARDVEGNPLLDEKVQKIALVLRSIDREAIMEWEVNVERDVNIEVVGEPTKDSE